jgi:formylglycine-generating enzyme required for sulfatase activity
MRDIYAKVRQPWLDRVLGHALLPRCVVVGPAGTGKTVLLQHVAWVLATDEGSGSATDPVHRVDRAGVRGDCPVPPIPILHTATTLAEHLRGDRPIREALVALLRSSETFGDVADAATVRAGIDSGRYVFLIDSLDEVPRRHDREALVAALGTLTGPTPRVILTTRPSAYTAVELPEGFVRVDIAPLDEDALLRLTRAWIACWAPGEHLDTVLHAIATMRHNFPAQTDERSPVENPLLLGCILQVYALYRRLPDDTAKLYYDMVRVLCETKIRAADDRDRETIVERYREALRELSLASQELGGTSLEVTAAHELLIERGFATRGTIDSWLQALANHTGLLRFEGTDERAVVRPWHRSYQEYLAAEAIALIYANRASDCVAWLREPRPGVGPRLGDASWRGTVRFLIGAAVLQHRAWGVNLIDAMVAAAEARPPDRARLYAVAVEGAAEYAATLFLNEPLRYALPRTVVDAFAVDGADWPIHHRLDVLDALGRLGDPRLPDPRQHDRAACDLGWVEVPAGMYMAVAKRAAPGSPRKQGRSPPKQASASHTLPATERDNAGFWIRRWPVTVAEFRPFAEQRPEHGIEFLHGIGAPLFDTVMWSDWAQSWRAQVRCPTRPIVHVNWYVARAFCAWAQRHWCLPFDGVVDLPTATEWQIAARRDTDRVYPWGNDEPGPYAWVNDDRGILHHAAYRGRQRALTPNNLRPVESFQDAPRTPPTPVSAQPRWHTPEGPTPVGAYPHGHTPEGIWDMAGNVFEWCASRFSGAADDDVPIADGNVDVASEVVCRGGSWNRSRDALAIAYRGNSRPSVFSDNVGFRVICRLPIHQHRLHDRSE